MSTVLKRFDLYSEYTGYCGFEVEASSDGDWVRAQDAYDHIAVLEAKIRTLETQLKDIKREK
jgi:glycine betaine/choline ABC-type transport system substrate-binding protein